MTIPAKNIIETALLNLTAQQINNLDNTSQLIAEAKEGFKIELSKSFGVSYLKENNK